MSDPASWTPAVLPRTWVDQLSLSSPRDLLTFLAGPLRGIFRRPRPIELPADVPGAATLPEYLRQEFHGMPNGYYSSTVSAGYARGFELVMLKRMEVLRDRMAGQLADCSAVLDVGCGAGRLAEAALNRGVADVWGLDPCPYALELAAARAPAAHFAQGLAEDSAFATGRFDGIGVCFVLHELPGPVIDRALSEFRRLLRPGGRLVIGEPSSVHIQSSWFDLIRHHGLAGAYFRMVASLAFEPFLDDWLGIDLGALLRRHGFQVDRDELGMPFREIVARRVADT